MKSTPLKTKSRDRVGEATYWLFISLLVGVPLAFSPAVYRMYSAPKFLLLLTGAAALLPFLMWTVMRSPERLAEIRRLLATRHVLLVSLYLIVIVISTPLGVSPVASLFGSSYDQMGLLTRLCFFVVFISLIVIGGAGEKRFRGVLWAMTLTGLAVATYAFMQFFGKDPFIQSRLYTFETEGGSLLRVNSTIGHSNYLGNFLLYVAPLGAGLGFASNERARRIGLTAAVLSTVAIVFSGTRGAWIGIVAAALVFFALARSPSSDKRHDSRRRTTIRWVGGAAIAILVLTAVVSLSPASRSIVLRARSLVHDDSGSGRTLLWRDSMKMVKDYALVGCGPEGFRKAFLPYKSDELARLAPETNNESSHNSFIDAAVSYGLAGAILYVAIIASSVSLLLNARRRATDRSARIIASALISSLAAVVVHNFFIFDQISTGLYFFVFAGLAQITSNNVAANTVARTERSDPRASRLKAENPEQASRSSPTYGRRLTMVLLVAASALFVIAAWYSIANMVADIEINRALASARAGRFDEVVEHGERAINCPDPAGDYHFLLARCLTLYADSASEAAGKSTQPERTALNETRKRAITLAMFHAENSVAHTLTPDSNYVLLAYLALQLGDADKLFTYASEAVRTDPKFSNSRWLMAEADLAKGDRDEAAREARLAVFLDPNSREARLALKRAMGVPKPTDDPQKLISYAKATAAGGFFEKARRVLVRGIRKSGGHCAECHSALASLCEQAGRYAEAISEWQAYEREAPARALAEGTAARIERLKRMGVQEH